MSGAANPDRGEATLVLESQPYVLRPTYEAIVAFEGSTGKGITRLAREALQLDLTLGEMAQIAAECIRAGGRATDNQAAAAVSAKRIGELLPEAEGGIVGAANVLKAVLSMAVTGGYTASGEVKPTAEAA